MAQTLKFGNKVWAAKEDSVLAYNDINNNYKPLPFDFARASIGTRVNKDGLIETMGQDIARIDYSDSADGVLLLEPASTNLLTESNYFSFVNQGSISYNNAISPTGENNAFKLTANGIDPFIQQDVTNTNTTFTLSVYAKGVGNTIGKECNFFLIGDNYVQVQQSSNFILTDQWKRFEATLTLVSTPSSFVKFRFDVPSVAEIGDETLIFGAQLEALSYPTSYIPTSGSTVTRAAETCNNSGNSEVFNDSEGVLFLDINYKNIQSTWQGIAITNNNNTSNRIFIGINSNTKILEIYFVSGGSTLWQPDFELSKINQFQKIAVKYKANDLALFVNGFEVATDNSVTTMPIGLSLLGFFGFGTSEPQYGCTKELGYYDTALTDAELETLTSYRNWVSMVNELNLNIIYNG